MLNKTTLSHIADIKLGLAFKSAIKDMGKKGNYYLVQLKDIEQDGRINYETLTRVIPEGNAEPHILKLGDIILRLRGPQFSASIIDRELNLPIITTNQSAVIRCDDKKISPLYLHWYLNSHAGQRYFDGISEGTNINKIGSKTILSMEIDPPDLEDQIKIGHMHKNWIEQKRVYKKLINNGDQLINQICNKIQLGQM